MAKKKHSVEWMIDRVNEYLDGKGSYESIAASNGIGYTTLRRWVVAYRHHGAEAFMHNSGNKQYNKEFKITCVEVVLNGELSVEECTAKFEISHPSVLRRWIILESSI